MTRVRFTTGGAESNELAIQMARSFHVERGDTRRWQVISPAQAYHGPTMATLGLTGRPGLQRPFGPYLPAHGHIPPSTWRFDPAVRQLSRPSTTCSRRSGLRTCRPTSASPSPRRSAGLLST